MNLLEVLKYSNSFLKKNNVKNASFCSEMIISHILKIKRSDLFLHYNLSIKDDDLDKINLFLQRRINKEPLEYIIGEIEFYDLKLEVTKDVLIPRIETEILVDIVSKEIQKDNKEGLVIFDVCTGSGCIGLSLKKKFPDAKVYLSDISKEALEVAKKNAIRNNLKVFFKHGDLLEPFSQKADIVICNPPYVSQEEFEDLDKDVKDFEPRGALIAKDNGFEYFIRLEKDLYKYLKPHAKVFFEMGRDQKEGLVNIFSNELWKNKKCIEDFSSNNRFFFVEIE